MLKRVNNKQRKHQNISNRRKKKQKDMWVKLKRIKGKDEQLEKYGKLYDFDKYLQEGS